MMSKEREFLKKLRYATHLENDLRKELEELLAQPEQDNIQYLLDQVARLTAENAMLKEKWSTSKPEQEPIACVAHSSVGFDVSHSVQGMPLLWLGKLEYGDKLYRVRVRDE